MPVNSIKELHIIKIRDFEKPCLRIPIELERASGKLERNRPITKISKYN
jgi:hypothetical protein